MTNTPSLLADLVGLPSVNPMGGPGGGPFHYEHRVSAYVEAFFRERGIASARQPVAPLRDNVVARYEPAGAARALLWEVHQDTVPVEAMTIDPFAGEVRGGRLYGRGACDVKGSMASMLLAFARLHRERPVGAAAVTLALTVDEEHTFLGVQELVRRGVRADAAVVAEPTGLDIVDAHKGVVRWRLVVGGRACHSSRPEDGVSAIYRIAPVIAACEEYARRLSAGRRDERLGTATLSVGRIDGGVSVNTVPDRCAIEIDRRLLPGESAADAHADFVRFVRAWPGVDFPFDCPAPWMACPALGPDGSAEIAARLGAAIDAVRGTHAVRAVPFGTDASSLAEGGVPSVVFGPGDIAQAHTADEWVELAQVDAAADILFRLACEWR